MLTPLDIESKEFKRSPLGYSIEDVNKFLDEVIEDYEKIYKENIELKDKINMLNEGIQYYKTMENTLQNTLILAEKTAEDTKSSAYIKGEQIKREAEMKANQIIQEAQSEIYKLNQKLERLKNQYETAKTQIRQLLLTELELIDKSSVGVISQENLAGLHMVNQTTNESYGNEDSI